MRFECDSCHAKYKISDEKVRGRVVRFPCRKCDHKILIDGREGDPDVTVPAGPAYGFDDVTRRSEPVSTFGHEAATARARRPSSPVRRRQSSVPPRRPSVASRTLSSGPVAAQQPGLTPPVPVMSTAGVGDVPEWHVSINDVPVGPIRLEEMAHKIDASAVSEYTLVWRDGFDEWRPLATVPELMALLHERLHSGPPSRTSFSSMPPFVDSRTSIAESEMPAAPFSHPPASELVQQDALVDFAPLADSLQPETGLPDALSEMSQPPAALGPEGVFPSSPQLGSFLGLPAEPDELVSVPSVPPEAAAATAEPRSGLSLGVLALIVAVAVFSTVVALLAFDRFGDSLLSDLLGTGEAGVIAAPIPAPVDAPVPVDEPEAAVTTESATEQLAAEDAEPLADGEEAEAVLEGEALEGEAAEGKASQGEAAEAAEGALAIEPPDPRDDGPKLAPARSRKPKVRRSPRPKPAAVAPKGESLSDEEQKVLNDFGSSADAAPADIDVKKSGSTQSKKPPLDGNAVRATVTTNKPRLQRCYERAIRGQQSPTSVRLDVTVMGSAIPDFGPLGRDRDGRLLGACEGRECSGQWPRRPGGMH
ncbi:MAG: zinc-ribbon domain-containing protein [Deltaproteobacteria bacterium]|nr:zinc-ribbon domain-containing protein [Deltaproteobacteria bacterium]